MSESMTMAKLLAAAAKVEPLPEIHIPVSWEHGLPIGEVFGEIKVFVNPHLVNKAVLIQGGEVKAIWPLGGKDKA